MLPGCFDLTSKQQSKQRQVEVANCCQQAIVDTCDKRHSATRYPGNYVSGTHQGATQKDSQTSHALTHRARSQGHKTHRYNDIGFKPLIIAGNNVELLPVFPNRHHQASAYSQLGQ